MYSIGRFSKMMGISTKTLIWYDNIGLLKPDFVNEKNGYRYYTDEAIKKLANIQYFQSLDFSIDEIMHMSKSVIESKMQELQKKIEHIEFNLSFLGKLKEEKCIQLVNFQRLWASAQKHSFGMITLVF